MLNSYEICASNFRKNLLTPESLFTVKTASSFLAKMKFKQLRNKYINEKYCNKTFKNNLVLNYHRLHCEFAQTSKSALNFVEKSILSSKSSSESPADKILKKLTETAKTTEKNKEIKPPTTLQLNKSRATVFNDKWIVTASHCYDDLGQSISQARQVYPFKNWYVV